MIILQQKRRKIKVGFACTLINVAFHTCFDNLKMNITFNNESQFNIVRKGGIAPKKGILNMSDIILYVFCIMAADQL